uniref:Uncharacterized protein n=1 Tax=Setaria viridis TaxID=4556 RepID=A0A4U6W6X2_SETVI|nr:hypothetical protein SEVIR_1G057000v2 [Setaria viridis]
MKAGEIERERGKESRGEGEGEEVRGGGSSIASASEGGGDVDLGRRRARLAGAALTASHRTDTGRRKRSRPGRDRGAYGASVRAPRRGSGRTNPTARDPPCPPCGIRDISGQGQGETGEQCVARARLAAHGLAVADSSAPQPDNREDAGAATDGAERRRSLRIIGCLAVTASVAGLPARAAAVWHGGSGRAPSLRFGTCGEEARADMGQGGGGIAGLRDAHPGLAVEEAGGMDEAVASGEEAGAGAELGGSGTAREGEEVVSPGGGRQGVGRRPRVKQRERTTLKNSLPPRIF